MAFVAVLPAVGTAVAAGAGAIGTGLAMGAGAIGSGIGAIGGLASSIPVIGSTLGGAIGSLGSGIGALGSGLGGSIGALGAGNLSGAVSSLGSGLLGAGSNLIGGVGGSLYGGADQLLGGFLPNIGGVGISPAQGYMGSMFKNSPMFGGTANPFDTHGVMNFNPNNPFDLAQAQGLTQPTGGIGQGLGGILNKGMGMARGVGETAGKINSIRNIFDPPGATQPGVYDDRVIERGGGEAQKPIILGGGQTPGNNQIQLAPQQVPVAGPTSYAPMNGAMPQMRNPFPVASNEEVVKQIAAAQPVSSPIVAQAIQQLNSQQPGLTSPQVQSLASTYGGGLSSMV